MRSSFFAPIFLTILHMAGETWTVRRLLEWTTPFFSRKEVDSPRLSAELLLASAGAGAHRPKRSV